MFSIILVEPEIPQNTGTIARLVACTGANLYLIGKLGFTLEDSKLKRAGLDYWDKLNVKLESNLDNVLQEYKGKNHYYLTTKAQRSYTEVIYKPGDVLIFGSETKGLPKPVIENNYENAFRIPMRGNTRSLNLANAVSIVLYEALRQNDFNGLE